MRVSGALMVISGPLNMGSTVAIVMTKVEDVGKGQAVVCTAQFYDCAKICAENYPQFIGWLQNGSRDALWWLQDALYADILSKRAT